MKRKRFSVEQIVGVLKQSEVVPVAELICQVGISDQTLYRWKKQYKGLETDQVRQLKLMQLIQAPPTPPNITIPLHHQGLRPVH